MNLEFCETKNKFCRFCMSGKCYLPEKSYPDDFKNRSSKIKVLGGLKNVHM